MRTSKISPKMQAWASWSASDWSKQSENYARFVMCVFVGICSVDLPASVPATLLGLELVFEPSCQDVRMRMLVLRAHNICKMHKHNHPHYAQG